MSEEDASYSIFRGYTQTLSLGYTLRYITQREKQKDTQTCSGLDFKACEEQIWGTTLCLWRYSRWKVKEGHTAPLFCAYTLWIQPLALWLCTIRCWPLPWSINKYRACINHYKNDITNVNPKRVCSPQLVKLQVHLRRFFLARTPGSETSSVAGAPPLVAGQSSVEILASSPPCLILGSPRVWAQWRRQGTEGQQGVEGSRWELTTDNAQRCQKALRYMVPYGCPGQCRCDGGADPQRAMAKDKLLQLCPSTWK